MLCNRVSIVTGAGNGIGRAVAQLFATHTARVVVADINQEAAQNTLDLLNDKELHSSVFVDVSDSKSVDSLMQFVRSKYNEAAAVVVNCAGLLRDNMMLSMSEEEFDQVINVNLKGTFLVTKASSAAMIESGIKNGSIINFGSIVGKVGNIGQCNYAASKAGVTNLTKTAAKELAKHGIRCNVVLPGFIDTQMVRSVPEKVIEKILPLIPMGRLGKPSEVAEVCLFLASDKSSFVTGTQIEVTGGLFM